MLRVGYLRAREIDKDAEDLRAAAAAAEQAGYRLTAVTPADLSESSDFDVILTADPTCVKVTSHPTFLIADQPRSAYAGDPRRLGDVQSFDGYLCASQALERLFAHLTAPTAKAKALKTPGRVGGALVGEPAATPCDDLPLRVALGPADPADRDARRLRRHLAGSSAVATFNETGRDAARAAYRSHGAGLVLPSLEGLVDDLVPAALLEIVSAGALAVCPNSPAAVEAFGDSVFYYEPFAEPAAVHDRITAVLADIAANPSVAAAKAERALDIFYARFSAQAVLGEAARYFARWTQAQRARAARFEETRIDVIMRAGGRSTAFVRRALDSIDAQSAGRYRVIVVCYQPMDLSEIVAESWRRIDRIEIVEAVGGNRSQTLVAGLRHVASPHFAILDDDDYLLADHFLGLLEATALAGSPHVFAYSDVLKLDEAVQGVDPLRPRWQVLQSGEPQGDFDQLIGRFTSHCFLATRETLALIDYGHWTSRTAEDGLLIFALLRFAEPAHSAAASCVYCQGRSDGSAFRSDPARMEDELSLMLEVGQTYRAVEDRFHRSPDRGPQMIAEAQRRLLETRRDTLQAGLTAHSKIGRAVSQVHGGAGGLLADAGKIVVTVPFSPERLSGSGRISQGGADAPLLVQMGAPWERSLVIDVSDHCLPDCSLAAELTLAGAGGGACLALLDRDWRVAGQTQLDAGSVQAAVIALGGPDLRAVALCAGAEPAPAAVQVLSLSLGYDLADLALHFSMPPDPDTVRQQLLGHLAGRPLHVGQPLRRIDFRSAASRFAHPFDELAPVDGKPLALGTGTKAWDYFAQIAVPATAFAGASRLRLRFNSVGDPFFVFLTDPAHTEVVGERKMMRAAPGEAEAWLDLAGPAEDRFVVFQCLENPSELTVTLQSIEAYG